MRKVICLLLVFVSGTISIAQNLQTTTTDFLSECRINFQPSTTTLDLEQLTRQFLSNCSTNFEVDKVVETSKFDQKLLKYNSQVYAFDFRPTIQNVFDVPTFQLGIYNEFEQKFRFSNPAFYEANNNTVLSSGYQSFICPTGGINF